MHDSHVKLCLNFDTLKSYECWSMMRWMILPLSLLSLGLTLINYYCSAYRTSVAAWIKKRFCYFCASIGFIGSASIGFISNISKSRYLVCIKQHRSTKCLFFSFCRYYNVFKDLSVVAILHSRSGFYIKLWRMLYISIPRIKYIICLGCGIAKKTGSVPCCCARSLNTCNA